MSIEAIIAEFPQLTREDVLACLSYAAAREQSSIRIPVAA